MSCLKVIITEHMNFHKKSSTRSLYSNYLLSFLSKMKSSQTLPVSFPLTTSAASQIHLNRFIMITMTLSRSYLYTELGQDRKGKLSLPRSDCYNNCFLTVSSNAIISDLVINIRVVRNFTEI